MTIIVSCCTTFCWVQNKIEDSDSTMENHNPSFGKWNVETEQLFKSQFPLHAACREDDVLSLDSLLQSGKHSVYDEDSFYGWTPAHFAAYFGKLKCLVRMAQADTNTDYPVSRVNQAPIHCASFGNHTLCVKWLLHVGASINRQDYLGETALHKAARTGSMECCALLVAQGANISLCNTWGQSAAALAERVGHGEVAQYLYSASQHAPGPDGDAPVPEQHRPCVAGYGLNGGLLPCPPSPMTNGPPHQEDEDMDDDDVIPPVAEVGVAAAPPLPVAARKRGMNGWCNGESAVTCKRTKTSEDDDDDDEMGESTEQKTVSSSAVRALTGEDPMMFSLRTFSVLHIPVTPLRRDSPSHGLEPPNGAVSGRCCAYQQPFM